MIKKIISNIIPKIIPRTLVFLLFFCISALATDKIINLSVSSVSREMDTSTLPVAYAAFDGKIINPMYGHTQVMQTSLLRNGVIPLDAERSVHILVDERAGESSTYSYELRSINGDNLIEKGDIEKTSLTTDGYRSLDINFRMDMKEGSEYTLVIISKAGDATQATGTNAVGESGADTSASLLTPSETSQKVRYYTRVTALSENSAAACIDYAYDFHYACLDKDASEDTESLVTAALDAYSGTSDSSDGLSHVTLSSSCEELTWGGLKISSVTSLIPTIVEADTDYTTVSFSYIAQSTDEGGTSYYSVGEYYDMHRDRTTGEISLLTFDRCLSSFFDASLIDTSSNSIGLGIADLSDVEYKASSDSFNIAFVKEGELFCYNYKKSTLTTVYSLLQGNFATETAGKRTHDINIDSIDDDGNIYFTVFGYISRGDHEGENGISLYLYTADDSKLSELLFVSSSEPYDVMKEETGRFTCFDGSTYYFLLGGVIYSVSLEDMELRALTDGLSSDSYIVSDDRTIVAYPNSESAEDVTELYIRNFATGALYTESAGEGCRLAAIGFVEDDIIYGRAAVEDIVVSANGKVTLPMNSLYIISSGGELKKEYSKSDVYIMSAEIEEDKIYLERAVKNGSFFTQTAADYLTYKKDEAGGEVSASEVAGADGIRVVRLTLPDSLYLEGSTLPVMTKQKANDGYTELEVPGRAGTGGYHVFSSRGYLVSCTTAGQAIERALYEDGLLVADSDGAVVYRRQDATSYNTVADLVCEVSCSAAGFAEGESVEGSLMVCAYMCVRLIDDRVELDDVLGCSGFEEAFFDTTAKGLDVSGIGLETALYFLDRDVPFAARVDDGRYVLVISYNDTHVRYYDPVADMEVKTTRGAFEDMMSSFGNTIYTFAK